MPRRPELFVLAAALLLTGCGDSAAPSLRIVSHNAGTTPFLDVLEVSPHRAICERWYQNNLCLEGSEAQLAGALRGARPSLVFLQEMWPQAQCEAADRPAQSDQAPYVCALPGTQLERVVPAGLSYACAASYPDNCIAFDPGRVEVAGCSGRDCSAQMRETSTECGGAGRTAWLEAKLEGMPLTLAVVHANAGFEVEDHSCRDLELAELEPVVSGTGAVIVAGDFNVDPVAQSGPDVDRLLRWQRELGLQRLPDDGDTAPLLGRDLDHVFVRGIAEELRCTLHRLDAKDPAPMFDHDLLDCR